MKTLANILATLLVISSVVFSSKAQVRFSERAGGANGENFMLPAERSDILSTKRIWRVGVKHSRKIEKIEIQYTNRQDSSQWESVGNDDGKWSYFELEKDEYIVYITGRAGTLIDQVSFHTSKRRTYGPYGGTGGQEFEISIPSNAVVIGFTGKSGPGIKQIGLIYRVMNKGSRLTKDRKRGTRYEKNGNSEYSKPASRKVRDHRTKNSSESASKRVVRDHRSDGNSDVSYSKPKQKEEKENPKETIGERFKRILKEAGTSKEEEVEEENPEPSEENPEEEK